MNQKKPKETERSRNKLFRCLMSSAQNLRMLWRVVVGRDSGMETCPCGWAGVALEKHYGQFPECRPATPLIALGPLATTPAPQSTSCNKMWMLQFERILGEHVAVMHLEKLMKTEHVECAVVAVQDAIALLSERIISVLEQGATLAQVQTVTSVAMDSVKKLKRIDKVCEKRCQGSPLSFIDRPLLGDAAKNRKHFAFFSLKSLLADVLQNDKDDRLHSLASSEEWSTGKLYQKEPTIMRDFQDAKRFRWSRAARPADPNEPDWMCPMCLNINLASRASTCSFCMATKGPRARVVRGIRTLFYMPCSKTPWACNKTPGWLTWASHTTRFPSLPSTPRR